MQSLTVNSNPGDSTSESVLVPPSKSGGGDVVNAAQTPYNSLDTILFELQKLIREIAQRLSELETRAQSLASLAELRNKIAGLDLSLKANDKNLYAGIATGVCKIFSGLMGIGSGLGTGTALGGALGGGVGLTDGVSASASSAMTQQASNDQALASVVEAVRKRLEEMSAQQAQDRQKTISSLYDMLGQLVNLLMKYVNATGGQ